MMFWDYSSDPAGALLDAINTGLQKNPYVHNETK
jgi:hypothetical protein